MKVLKFGGTSVGSATNMRMVAETIVNEASKVTVLSAMSETTNGLVKICSLASNGELDSKTISYLKAKYTTCSIELLSNPSKALELVDATYTYIKQQASEYTPLSDSNILAQGELLTTAIFTIYLNEIGLKAKLINVPECMHTLEDGSVNLGHLAETLGCQVKESDNDTIFITQGFICTNHRGELDNLGRGGSDYSAALIGEAIGADEVQIWTDIDGMHNNDPRYVEGTYPIRHMSFNQAAELAYFGAKILHPATIQPCQRHGISVRLKNTMDPAAEGTLINDEPNKESKYCAVAAKDDITVVRICSARMLMAYGFLRQVFEVFENHKTPIDMITTSEVAVSLTIDNNENLQDIVSDLNSFGKVTYNTGNSIICVAGDIPPEEPGINSIIFDSINDIPIKMISYGASSNSISFLISSDDKVEALRKLNDNLF